MGKYGRPKLPAGERRNARMLNVRLNAEEEQTVAQKAAAAGVTMTEWMRLAALEKQPPERRVIPEINRAAWLELSKLAATLNGAMWRFRLGSEPELRVLFECVRSELGSFRNMLIGNDEDKRSAEK